MEIQGGLCCRWCGRKWFAGSVRHHEIQCRKKCVSLLERYENLYNIDTHTTIPPYTEEPIPSTRMRDAYNSWASNHFMTETFVPCLHCNRKMAALSILEHCQSCQTYSAAASPGNRTQITPKKKAGKKPLSHTSGHATPKHSKRYARSDAFSQSAFAREALANTTPQPPRSGQPIHGRERELGATTGSMHREGSAQGLG
ncbi:hypothetical protein KIPB_007648, partial [Kipferlia bialata]|eukprot:g7648.t1